MEETINKLDDLIDSLEETTEVLHDICAILEDYNEKLEKIINGTMIGKHDGSTGWYYHIDSSGRVSALGQATGTRQVRSYQSIPLNKWVALGAANEL